jgi:hypothetical protein
VTPLAHVGHWLADLVYLAPLAVLAVVVLAGRLRERRQRVNRSTR